MQVKLYTFSKRNNSTKQPTGGDSYSCRLKDDSSVLNPIITFSFNFNDNPSDYNYAYISDYSRYYFIENWTFTNGIWECSMSVDVLASYKTTIGNSSLYVLRSASSHNGNIKDNLYPTTNLLSYSHNVGSGTVDNNTLDLPTINYFAKSFSSGYVVVGVTGDTGIKYYSMLATTFNNSFIHQLLSVSPQILDIGQDIVRAIVNPIQYIVSVMWYPNNPTDATYTNKTIYIREYYFTVLCAEVTKLVNEFSYSISLTPHPQKTGEYSDADYLNEEPFTQRTLVFEPFGSFKLDTSVISSSPSSGSVRCTWYVDYITGEADLYVMDYSSRHLLVSTSAQLGVPLRLTQSTVDFLGLLRNITSLGAGIAGVASGAGAASGLFALGNVADAAYNIGSSKVNNLGANGSLLAFNAQEPEVFSSFYYASGMSNSQNGRPLYEQTTINTLSGFVLCQKGDIAIDIATRQEKEKISSYLTSGFFYE